MRITAGNIPNLRTITSLRGDSLKIDLGKVFDGELIAWMKKDKSELEDLHRTFSIIDNRYIYLDRKLTLDYYLNGELLEAVEGRWHFEVKQTLNSGEEDEEIKTVYRGVIRFVNNITGTTGIEFGTDEENALQVPLQIPL